MNLKSDDFQVGMVIAVTGEPQRFSTTMMGEKIPSTTDWGQTLWTISAIDRPFLVLDQFPGPYGMRRMVDTRIYQFKKMNPEFTRAMEKAK